MTGVYEEARATGTLGPLGVALLYDTVDAVRRFSGFPPPAGHEQWDETAVMGVAHDFLAAPSRVAGVLLRAVDDDSLERLLDAAVANYLRSEYRKTERGRMMRSLRRVVENEQEVVIIPAGVPGAGSWSLPGHEDQQPFAGRVANLIEAAYAVPGVKRARWREDAKHRPPMAEPDSLRRVIRAVLSAAGSPVTPATVLQVMAARFPVADAVPVEALTDLIAEQTPDASAGSSAARLMAEDIWDHLNDNERLVVGILDEPVRNVSTETGLSRGTAHRAVIGAKAVVAEHLGDEAEALAVIGEMRRLSDLLRLRGTRRAGLASDPGENQ